MSEINITMRFNEQSEEVEVLVGDEVLISSGVEEFKSWVEFYNEKYPGAPVEEEESPTEDSTDTVDTPDSE